MKTIFSLEAGAEEYREATKNFWIDMECGTPFMGGGAGGQYASITHADALEVIDVSCNLGEVIDIINTIESKSVAVGRGVAYNSSEPLPPSGMWSQTMSIIKDEVEHANYIQGVVACIEPAYKPYYDLGLSACSLGEHFDMYQEPVSDKEKKEQYKNGIRKMMNKGRKW